MWICSSAIGALWHTICAILSASAAIHWLGSPVARHRSSVSAEQLFADTQRKTPHVFHMANFTRDKSGRFLGDFSLTTA